MLDGLDIRMCCVSYQYYTSIFSLTNFAKPNINKLNHIRVTMRLRKKNVTIPVFFLYLPNNFNKKQYLRVGLHNTHKRNKLERKKSCSTHFSIAIIAFKISNRS